MGHSEGWISWKRFSKLGVTFFAAPYNLAFTQSISSWVANEFALVNNQKFLSLKIEGCENLWPWWSNWYRLFWWFSPHWMCLIPLLFFYGSCYHPAAFCFETPAAADVVMMVMIFFRKANTSKHLLPGANWFPPSSSSLLCEKFHILQELKLSQLASGTTGTWALLNSYPILSNFPLEMECQPELLKSLYFLTFSI